MGIPTLREALAEKLLRENAIDADPGTEILVTNGTQEALLVSLLALLDPGDEILVPSPYYDEYRRDAMIAGGRLVLVPTREEDDFELDPAAIEAYVTPRTKGLILITPNSPTGAMLPRETLQAIAKVVKKHDLVVVADEIYEKFVYDDWEHVSIASLPGMWERTITINGFSKHYAMTGWRVGYLTAPADIVQKMVAIKHSMTICAPSISQWAALEAVTGPMDWWAEVLDGYRQRRRIWMDALDEMGLTYGLPKGAFYIFANVTPTGMTGTEFSRALRQEARVLAGAGASAGNDDYVRVSFNAGVDQLQEGLARMSAAVARWKNL
jgi:aminotransferase